MLLLPLSSREGLGEPSVNHMLGVTVLITPLMHRALEPHEGGSSLWQEGGTAGGVRLQGLWAFRSQGSQAGPCQAQTALLLPTEHGP